MHAYTLILSLSLSLSLSLTHTHTHTHTVKSFVEVSKYLLSLPGYPEKYILSECFSQDPLENFFGQVRGRGGRSENPSVQACLESTQSLRVQGSVSLLPVRGNSSRKRRLLHKEVIDDTPLPKRRRQAKKLNNQDNE